MPLAMTGRASRSVHRIASDTRSCVSFAHRRLHDRRHVLAVPLKRLIRITDLRPPMRRWLAVLVEIDEHHLLDSQNALARDLVANFAAQRDRRAAEVTMRWLSSWKIA